MSNVPDLICTLANASGSDIAKFNSGIAKCKNHKQRNNFRKRFRIGQAIKVLQSTGASCCKCAHFSSPNTCELHSDFYGEQKTEPNNICLDFKAA